MPTMPSLRGGTRIEAAGMLTSGTTGATIIPTNASANVKGAWTQLIAATAFEAQGFYVSFRGVVAAQDVLFDIGIGGAGSEQVIVSNMAFSQQTLRVAAGIYIPLAVPKASRLSVRAQGTTGGGNAISIAFYPVAAGLKNAEGFSRAVNMGANTADSGGTSVDPGGSANTKGAWSQLTAATPFDIQWLVVCITNQNNSATTTAIFAIDIGIGAGGSEVVVIPDLFTVVDSGIDTPEPQYYSFPVSIPAGSRVAARAQTGITDATDRLLDITLIGLG